MKWFSQKASSAGVEYIVEGWHIEQPEDYAMHLRCGRCQHESRIDRCVRLPASGIGGNVAAAPVFDLGCPACGNLLAMLDESQQQFAAGPVPSLHLRPTMQLVEVS